jgi:hypothetical protein
VQQNKNKNECTKSADHIARGSLPEDPNAEVFLRHNTKHLNVTKYLRLLNVDNEKPRVSVFQPFLKSDSLYPPDLRTGFSTDYRYESTLSTAVPLPCFGKTNS